MPTLTVNGLPIHFSDTGLGEETIVFSHGLLFDNHLFDKQIAELSQHYRCVSYDHPGQGASGMPPLPFSMEDLYSYAAGFIEALNIGPVHFVGLSMGGFIGMRLAARRPELIKSLTLLDTSAEDEPNKLKYTLLNTIVRFFGAAPVTGAVMPIMFSQTFLNDPARREEKALWTKHMQSLPRNIVHSVNAVISRRAVADEIPGISVPTLIAVGLEDVATVPAKAEKIHALIPGSQLKYIKGAGHSSTIEEAGQINDMIRAFLGKVGQ